jgi:hypothetical protein
MKNLILCPCLLITACAAAPPSQPLTREQRIQQAVYSSTMAGGDGEATYEKLHLLACLQDVQQLPQAQQSAAIAQCRVDWPQKPDVTISSR